MPALPDGPATEEPFTPAELRDGWDLFDREERLEAFRLLPRVDAEDFFLDLSSADQASFLLSLPPPDRRLWIRFLAFDDVVDLVQEAPPEERDGFVVFLDDTTKKDVGGLLAFAEDDAGGL